MRIAILVSGRGSNMQALARAIRHEHLPVKICSVLSDRATAPALDWARQAGFSCHTVDRQAFASRAAFDAALSQQLRDLAPDYIFLAGFMRILNAELVEYFKGRIINIHPSLLPAFPGLDTHARALAAGVQWHGCTVHFVTPDLDQGPIIAQGVLPVRPQDDAQSLAARLLPLEHKVYVQVLHWLIDGRLRLRLDGTVSVTGDARRAIALDDSLE